MLVLSGSVQDSIDRAALAGVLDLLRARGFLPHITIVRDDYFGDPWGYVLSLATLTLRFGKDAYAEYQTHHFSGGQPPPVDPGSN